MADEPAKRHTLDDLLAVMARLRDPVSGCPWDAQQSFDTIVPYTIEEAYEVADAIARQDLDALKDELGDLLLPNIARHLCVDPEAALRSASAKFVRRIKSIEAALAAEGRKPEDSTLEEMDQLWDEAKGAETKA
jgi:ATP diphosphatase